MKTVHLLLLLLTLTTSACHLSADQGEIDQSQAVQIARQQVSFVPESVEARKGFENGRPIWQITFRSAPLKPNSPIAQIMIVTLDRGTGVVLGLARN